MSAAEPARGAWIDVDIGAIERNASRLAALVAPARLCAVVKADGYGHGAVPSARAALGGGAHLLAVATVAEGRALRDADVDDPIVLLSTPADADVRETIAAHLEPVIARCDAIGSVGRAGRDAGRIVRVHLKVDTGMRRIGLEPVDLASAVRAVRSDEHLELGGVMTHFARADEPDDPTTVDQHDRFIAALADVDLGAGTQIHAANSAAALTMPSAHHDLVRAGIALYGLSPGAAVRDAVAELGLEPAMAVRARISHLKAVGQGVGVSYGHRYRTSGPALLATLPLGYADGVPRRYAETGGVVSIGGRRVPVAGSVTMDQLVVDLGDPDHAPNLDVAVGDLVTLVGTDPAGGGVPVDEWADRLGTITYEVVTAFGRRLPRRYIR